MLWFLYFESCVMVLYVGKSTFINKNFSFVYNTAYVHISSQCQKQNVKLFLFIKIVDNSYYHILPQLKKIILENWSIVRSGT